MRKIKEIFIAIHIEQLLSKQEIMTLYVNKIFLGYRSYGFGAAAQVYFGKNLQDLTLSEIATLAGMPKAPSTMNPIYSLERATNRRNVVLKRMLDEGYITRSEYEQAKAEPIVARYHARKLNSTPLTSPKWRAHGLWSITAKMSTSQALRYTPLLIHNCRWQRKKPRSTTCWVTTSDTVTVAQWRPYGRMALSMGCCEN